jgi:DNA repair protein RadD
MYEAREHTEEAINALFNYHWQGNPVIALPTGTGKSWVPAEFIRRTMFRWANQRFIIATHRKDLIEQNAETLLETWPNAPYGICSSGLNRKDTDEAIIFGGIASMYRNPAKFGRRDILFVDEAHLISEKDSSMYRTFIEGLKKINPKLRVVGLTATDYRTGEGKIAEGNGLFTEVICNWCTREGFAKLLKLGYLAPLFPKRTEAIIDTSDVHVRQGEFVPSELETATERVTYACCVEIAKAMQTRKAGLIFCSGIKNSEHTAAILTKMGFRVGVVHSKIKGDRKKILDAFKAGQLDIVCNNDILTTGFNHPAIDLIGMMRATLSTGLWVQMLGRGTRPCTFKDNCIALDFAGNTLRLGPIDDPKVPKRKGEEGSGVAPVKICDYCGTYNHCSVRFCIDCGHEFAMQSKLIETASTLPLMSVAQEQPIYEEYNVTDIIYTKHQKRDQPSYMIATYICAAGTHIFKDNVCLDHEGFASKKARDWWRERTGYKDAPPNTDTAMQFVRYLRKPIFIKVHTNHKYKPIVGYKWE